MPQNNASIADFIRVTADLLDAHQAYCGHGTDNYQDESRWLVLGSLGLPFDCDDEQLKQVVSTDEQTQLKTNIEKRVTGKQPTAYILGEAWYGGRAYVVNEQVLVPRSPIAELVAADLKPWCDQAPSSVLDLCCGSGCIGIDAALKFSQATVDLADISEQALAVAEQNIQRFELKNRVTAYQGDLFGALTGKQYDVILSNPPYVPQFEYDELPIEYHNEPVLGLVSGEDGLELPVQILAQAAQYLNDGGILVLEVGNTAQFLDDCFPELEFEWIEFAHGGDGVCVISKQQLQQHQHLFDSDIEI